MIHVLDVDLAPDAIWEVHRLDENNLPLVEYLGRGLSGIVYQLFSSRHEAERALAPYSTLVNYVLNRRRWHPSIIAEGIARGSVIDRRTP